MSGKGKEMTNYVSRFCNFKFEVMLLKIISALISFQQMMEYIIKH